MVEIGVNNKPFMSEFDALSQTKDWNMIKIKFCTKNSLKTLRDWKDIILKIGLKWNSYANLEPNIYFWPLFHINLLSLNFAPS